MNVEYHLRYHEEQIKVWLVTDDFREVINALSEGWNQYGKYHKFEEVFSEHTFYMMKDYDFLMKNVSLMTSAHEGINIFYPLEYTAVFEERRLALTKELINLHGKLVPEL